MADTSLDLLMNPRLKSADALTSTGAGSAFGGLLSPRQTSFSGGPGSGGGGSGAGGSRLGAGSDVGGASSGSGDEDDDGDEEDEGDDGDDDGDEDDGDDGGDDDTEEGGGDGASSVESIGVRRPPRALTLAEIAAAKKECLYKLDRLEKHGVKLPRRHTMASDLLEMQSDIERVQNDRAADASVRFQKRALMTVVSGIEWANSRFDPFDVHLDGWSENMHDNLDDYDEVMEELHQKYRGRGQMAPELKLVMMIVSSGFMFHMSHAFAKNVSRSMNDAMRNNPDLMRQFAAATAGEMKASPSFAGNAAAAAAAAGVFGMPKASPTLQAPPAPRGPAGGMRGPIGVSSSRIEEVLKFNRELDEAADGLFDEPGDAGGAAAASGGGAGHARLLADASSRPPLPAMTKASAEPQMQMPKPGKAGLHPRRPSRVVPSATSDAVEGDTDLVEIMSAASDASGAHSGAVSSSTRKGRTRRTLVL